MVETIGFPVTANKSSAGDYLPIDSDTLAGCTVTNSSAYAVEYSTGGAWTTIAAGGSATINTGAIATTSLRFRKKTGDSITVVLSVAVTHPGTIPAQLATDAAGNVTGIGSAKGLTAFESRLEKSGAVLTGTTDDSVAIQDALEWMAATYPRVRAQFPAGSTIKLNSGLTLYADAHAIDFNGAIINPVGNIVALTVSSLGSNNEYNNMCYVAGAAIEGDLTTGQTGIYTNRVNGSGYGPSRFGFHKITVRRCDIGEQVGNNSYGQGHYGCNYVENNTGIKSPNGQTNSYELPKWIDCWVANNILGLDVAEGQLTFDNCHIDYNRKQGTLTGGRVLLIGTHVESNLKRTTYSAGQVSWTLSGEASLIGQGGRLIFTPGDAGGVDLDYIFDCQGNANYGGGVFWDRPTLERCTPASGYMAKGVGTCQISRSVAKTSTPMPKGVHEAQNMLGSGGFEAATFPLDNVFVSSGGGNTSRTASANVTITQGAAAARTGSNGLIITKNTAAGASGSADVCIWANIDDVSRMHAGRLWFKAPSSTAQITIQYGYFAAIPKVAGSDIYWQPTDTDTMTISPTQPSTLSTTWTEVTVPIPYRRPKPGMTFVGFRIRVHLLGSAEVMYIDDSELHAF